MDENFLEELISNLEDLLGVKTLDKKTAEERAKFNRQYPDVCLALGIDEEAGNIEKKLSEEGYRFKFALANLPAETYEEFKCEQALKLLSKNGENKLYVLPAWWLPNVMSNLKIKDMLPFAVYVK